MGSESIEKSLVSLFIGPGGVGKTTLSASYALRESQNNPNKKYKLITVDPSKRLRDVFSMGVNETEKMVKDNLEVSLNQREVLFRDFLKGSLSKKGLLEDFYQSSILNSLLEDLSVSQEFTTFFELVRAVESNDYEAIVIDTPPLQNAADFMTSASKLEALFSSKILALFLAGRENQSLLYRMIHTSRQLSFKLLKTLTGEDFVKELELFFEVTEVLRKNILDVLNKSKKILEERSHFYTVCNHTELSLKSLHLSLRALKKDKNFNIKKAFVNKFDNNASQPVNEALSLLKGSVNLNLIKYTDKDLSNLDVLSKLLDEAS